MFSWAKAFNCDISKWDVFIVFSMENMFFHAVSFEQKLCGAEWVNSEASKQNMFTGSSGSISRTVCTSAPTPVTDQAPRQYVSPQPKPDRELIARKTISTPSITSTIGRMMRCPRCGTFRKSGRVSCCAPGGAWFKNCGGIGSKNVGHRWSEGAKACKRKSKTIACNA